MPRKQGVTSEFVVRALAILFPIHCLGCRQLISDEIPPLTLCRSCRGKLRPVHPPCCRLCNLPFKAHAVPTGFVCGHCRSHPPGYDRLLCGWEYRPPLDDVILALKFHRLQFLGEQIADALIAARHRELMGFDFVVPVPLHWFRQMRRGYNQAEAIARPLASMMGIPMLRALRKTRPTPPLSRLDRRMRARRIRGAYSPRQRKRLAGRSILLIDDVFTTGATLSAAASVLGRAGAANITGFAAARTPGLE